MWISTVPHPPCDDYQVHQYLWCYFPNKARDAPRPFLFRVDGSRIMMLSAARPATQCVQIPPPERERVYQFSVLASPLLGTWRDAEGRRHRRGSYAPGARFIPAAI